MPLLKAEDCLLDPIETEILSRVRKLWKVTAGKRKTGWWTKKLFKTIGELGAEKGFEVWNSKYRKANGGEWLWDMTWTKENEKTKHWDVELVLESEWQAHGLGWLRTHHRLGCRKWGEKKSYRGWVVRSGHGHAFCRQGEMAGGGGR